MIIYDLQCEAAHRFEGWFDNADDYERQRVSGRLSCPVCGSEQVSKVPSAPYISTQSSSEAKGSMHELAALQRQSAELLRKLHEHVDSHYEDVGAGFAEEARKIHYGETARRDIRGVATAGEIAELKDEGVPTLPLPPRPPDKRKLN